MGGRFLASLNGEEESSPLSYKEIFRKVFPYYLSLGMTPAEFWDGDCELVRFYREAHELKKEQKNQELWLQGLYIYEAIANLSPLLKAFVKNPKPRPYPEKPYPLTTGKIEEEKEKEQEKAKTEQFNRMKQWMQTVNSRMEKKNERPSN